MKQRKHYISFILALCISLSIRCMKENNSKNLQNIFTGTVLDYGLDKYEDFLKFISCSAYGQAVLLQFRISEIVHESQMNSMNTDDAILIGNSLLVNDTYVIVRYTPSSPLPKLPEHKLTILAAGITYLEKVLIEDKKLKKNDVETLAQTRTYDLHLLKNILERETHPDIIYHYCPNEEILSYLKKTDTQWPPDHYPFNCIEQKSGHTIIEEAIKNRKKQVPFYTEKWSYVKK